jgi:hypothetical protein
MRQQYKKVSINFTPKHTKYQLALQTESKNKNGPSVLNPNNLKKQLKYNNLKQPEHLTAVRKRRWH